MRPALGDVYRDSVSGKAPGMSAEHLYSHHDASSLMAYLRPHWTRPSADKADERQG